MADFPTSKKTWADLLDGVSPANSSDINSAYAEITAIEDAFLTDSTSLNASTDIHGFLPKLSGTATEYMDGTGNWSIPAGSGATTDLTEHNHSDSDTGGVIRLDTISAPTDVTMLNASTDAHGLLPKLSGTSDEYLNGKGEWWHVPIANTTIAGKLYLAATSDINAGSSDLDRAITTDKFAESNYGIRFVYAPLNGETALAAGNKAYFPIPAEMTGWNLVQARATCGANTSSDATVFTVKKGGGTQTLLSTNITIDPTLLDSLASSDQPVISSSDNPVTSTDIIEVAATSDCGAGMTYAGVLTGWQLP